MSIRNLSLVLLLSAAPVFGQPDLAVTSFSLEDSSADPGDRISANVTVCNFGNVEVDDPDPSVGYFLSADSVFDRNEDTLLATDDVTGSLDPGECDGEGEQFGIPSNTEPGEYTLFAVADPFDFLNESNEANNVQGRAFRVNGSVEPDFTVTASASPTTIAPGGTTTVTVVVTNNTSMGTTLDGSILARQDGDVVLIRLIGAGFVAAGSTVTRSFPLRAPAGAPAGVYDVTFNVGSFGVEVFADDTFQVTVSGARLAGAGVPFEAEPVSGDLFAEVSSGVEASALAAWPNPAAGAVTLGYTLEEAAVVRLVVYDVLGREVAVVADGLADAGRRQSTLDASALPAGLYFVRLSAGGRSETRRLTLMR